MILKILCKKSLTYHFEFVFQVMSEVLCRVEAFPALMAPVAFYAIQTNIVKDLEGNEPHGAYAVRDPTSDHGVRDDKVNTQVPRTPPQQEIGPSTDKENEVFKQELPDGLESILQLLGNPAAGVLQQEQDDGGSDPHHHGDDVRHVVPVRKEKIIGNVPYAAPDTNTGEDDDELGEQAVQHVLDGLRRLARYKKKHFRNITAANNANSVYRRCL